LGGGTGPTIVTEIILVCLLLTAVLWFLPSRYNPVWEVWARWPRTLAASDLSAKFDGLIRFGQPGSGISLASKGTRDIVSFSKMSGPGSGEFSLLVHSEMPPEIGGSASLVLGENGHLDRKSNEPGYTVSSVDPARLEALTREIIRSLRHSPDERYRVVFRGPSDARAVNEYFGLN
jgi:hypothetical protein